MKNLEKLDKIAKAKLRQEAPIEEIKKARAELIEEVEKERKDTRVIVDLFELKNDFKSKCSLNGSSMQEVLFNAVKLYLK